MAQQKTSDKTQGPVKTFRAGGVSAKVWENEVTVDGKKQKIQNVAIERTYKDKKTDEFKTTSSFKQNDLPKVAAVAQEAYKYLTMKEDNNDEEDQ